MNLSDNFVIHTRLSANEAAEALSEEVHPLGITFSSPTPFIGHITKQGFRLLPNADRQIPLPYFVGSFSKDADKTKIKVNISRDYFKRFLIVLFICMLVAVELAFAIVAWNHGISAAGAGIQLFFVAWFSVLFFVGKKLFAVMDTEVDKAKIILCETFLRHDCAAELKNLPQ